MSTTETWAASGSSHTLADSTGSQPVATSPDKPVRAATGTLKGVASEVFTHFSLPQAARIAVRNAFRVDNYFQLAIHLSALPEKPPRKIGGGELQRLTAEEVNALYARLPALAPDERKELLARLIFFQRGFTNGYALREGAEIAYLQWIVYPAENGLLTTAYHRRFAALGPKEVLIENAFTFPAFRGRGFLAHATWQLLSEARRQGYHRAITFTLTRNLNALNTFTRAGFGIQRRVREYSVCGRPWRTTLPER